MKIKVIYSYIYNRHLNYHRSKEQIKRRFEKLEGSCEEFKELTERFLLKNIKELEKYTGNKIPREAIRIYIVDRDRGGSFHTPLTLQFDEDQKYMYAELLHLIGHHLVDDSGALGETKINLAVETVLLDMPLDFTKQIMRLHKNQENRYPVEYFRMDPKEYDLNKKNLKLRFAKKEE